MKTGTKYLLVGAVLSAAFAVSPARRGPVFFQISTTAFSSAGTIPKKYTCDGPDVSPPLNWTEAPAATKSFALIADDPDAPVGTWVHWVVFNVPAIARQLSEGVKKEEQLADGTRQGRNDFRKIGYGGPCPPPGPPHRYYFKLYALDTMLNRKAGAAKQDVERAMQGHVVGETQLTGRYGR